MDVVSFFNHPTEGMFGKTNQTIEEAQAEAQEFVSQKYPGVPIMDPWTLTGWWLLEDKGLPFFHPKPWPFAFAVKKSSIYEDMGTIPSFMMLLATNPNVFGFKPHKSLEEARADLNEISKREFRIVDNPHGGLTAYWKDPEENEHTVAHVIAL